MEYGLPKNVQDFEQSLEKKAPDSNWPLALQSLWYAAKDDWEASHDIAQDLDTDLGSWIHAHLHRVEGDEFNAGYWYSRARKPYCSLSFKEEIKEIVIAVLNDDVNS